MKVTAFRSRQKDFEQFFITQGELSACKIRMLRSDGNNKHQVQSGRMVTIYRLFHALLEISVVGQGKYTAFNPCSLCHPQKGNIWKWEGNSQLCELQNISVAHLQWFEGNCHSIQATNKKAPRLIRASLLSCPVLPCSNIIKFFFKPEPVTQFKC